MAFDKQAFLKLAQKNADLSDDDLPDDDEDMPEPPTKEDLGERKPYSSIAREGAPAPALDLPDADGDSAKKADPLMARFNQDQARLESMRQAQHGSDLIAGISEAGQQIAMGSKAPQINDSISNQQSKAAENALKIENQSAENRARVMGAIEARSQRQEMFKDRAQERASLETQKSKDRALQRDMLQSQKDAALQDKRQKQADLVATPYGPANSPDDAKKVKEADEANTIFNDKLQELIDLRTKHGGGALFAREDIARGKQLAKDLLIQYNHMAQMGVLSKGHAHILNDVIPQDPLAFSMTPGQDPIMSNLKGLQRDAQRDFNTRIKGRLKQSPSDDSDDSDDESDDSSPTPPTPAAKPAASEDDQEHGTLPDALDSKVDAFMKKNGIKDKGQALSILKANGKI